MSRLYVPFRDLKGHRHLLELLASAAARESVPQSLLFDGPAGVGKRLTAIALAQVLNCLSPVDGIRPVDGISAPSVSEAWQAPGVGPRRKGKKDSCGICPSCRKIARGVHPDVLVLAPGETGSIKVEDVRDAIGRAAYRPFEGRRRVTIIDEAEALGVHAQDALLKTLEEPPAGSIFVLVTSRADALLPTIRSRCFRLRFGRLAEADVAAILQERHGWKKADAGAAAAIADGSAGAALDARTEEAVQAREAAADVLRGVAAERHPAARLEHARALAGGAERDELARRLLAAASMLRDVQVLASRADAQLLANADLRGDLEGLTAHYGGERALAAFAAVDRALQALDRNASPKVVADWLALEL